MINTDLSVFPGIRRIMERREAYVDKCRRAYQGRHSKKRLIFFYIFEIKAKNNNQANAHERAERFLR